MKSNNYDLKVEDLSKMLSPYKKVLKIWLYVVLFCIPIICLVCGIIIQKEGLVIGGTMGILLAFIISILLEFHERQVKHRQSSIRILVSSEMTSMRNIRIEIVDAIPDDINIKVNELVDSNINCGASKDSESEIKVVSENI